MIFSLTQAKMAITLDEPTFVDQILYYGLLAGAVFQLVCIFAAVYIPHSENEEELPEEPSTEAKGTAHSAQSPFVRKGGKKEKKKYR